MFKIHPITNIIDLILFFLILICSQSSIPILLIVLFLIIINHKHENCLLYMLFNLLIVVINILCGKLIILGRLLTLISYLLTIFVDYDEIDFIRVYDTLFSSTDYKRTEMFLKIIYFKEYFKKNFNIITDSTRKLGYHNNFFYYIFCIKKAFFLTEESLKQIIKTYEKRFYFNENRNKYKVVISIVDIFMLAIHVLFFVIILMLGV